MIHSYKINTLDFSCQSIYAGMDINETGRSEFVCFAVSLRLEVSSA